MEEVFDNDLVDKGASSTEGNIVTVRDEKRMRVSHHDDLVPEDETEAA